MSLYDEYNPLLWTPEPFWAQSKPATVTAPPPVPPVTAPAVAPVAAPELPEVEGEGYASLEEISPPAKPPGLPEVEGKGYASLEELGPAVDLPEAEGPGYASLEEIGKPEKKPGLLETVHEGAKELALTDWKKELAEVPGETADYWKKMQARWAMGREQAFDDQLAYRALSGEVKWEDVKDQLEPSAVAQKAKGEHWYSEGLLQAVEMLPAMLDSLREGSLQGAGWAAAAAGAASIGGAAAIPAAVAGFGAGQTYGNFEYWRRQGSGNLYNDLRKEGIGHEVAKNVALGFGAPYAGIEFLQLTKLVPGMKESVAHAIAGGIKKKLIALGKEGLVDYATQIGQETSQELIQGTSEAIAEWQAGVKPPPDKKGIWDRAWDTIKQTAISMPFLMGPKAAIDVGRIVSAPGAPPAEVPIVPAVAAPDGLPEVVPGRQQLTPSQEAEQMGILPAPGISPGAVVPPVPGAAPGVTIASAPGEVPVPPDLVGATAAALPVVPPVTPPGTIEPGPSTPAGEAVTQHVGAGNIAVTQEAAKQAQNLQAAGAPQTAQAIQQVAQASNAGATVSAAEFLAQAKAQIAEEEAAAAAKAAPEAPAATAAPGAVQPGEFAQPGYTAVAPASAEAPAPAAPTEPTPAVVVGGQVFTGQTHAQALSAAHLAVGPDAINTAVTGWVDPETGRFASHEIYDAHQNFNAVVEQSGGDMAHPAVQQATAALTEAQAREDELNSQIVQPGGEQVVQPGIKGQEALVAVRPSQELAVPLAGVNVAVEAVTPEGQSVTVQRSAAEALNETRNDRTALTILLDCLH